MTRLTKGRHLLPTHMSPVPAAMKRATAAVTPAAAAAAKPLAVPATPNSKYFGSCCALSLAITKRRTSLRPPHPPHHCAQLSQLSDWLCIKCHSGSQFALASLISRTLAMWMTAARMGTRTTMTMMFQVRREMLPRRPARSLRMKWSQMLKQQEQALHIFQLVSSLRQRHHYTL